MRFDRLEAIAQFYFVYFQRSETRTIKMQLKQYDNKTKMPYSLAGMPRRGYEILKLEVVTMHSVLRGQLYVQKILKIKFRLRIYNFDRKIIVANKI